MGILPFFICGHLRTRTIRRWTGVSSAGRAATVQRLPVVFRIRANPQPVLPDRAISCRFPVRDLCARVEQLRGIAGWDARSG